MVFSLHGRAVCRLQQRGSKLNNKQHHKHESHSSNSQDSHEHHHKHESGGHDQHEGHSPDMFRDKFWLSLVLTLPVVFWSAHIQLLLGYQAPAFPGSSWIPPIIGTAVFFYGGLIFLRGSWKELKARLPGMMTLISLAIAVAFIFSWIVRLGVLEAEEWTAPR